MFQFFAQELSECTLHTVLVSKRMRTESEPNRTEPNLRICVSLRDGGLRAHVNDCRVREVLHEAPAKTLAGEARREFRVRFLGDQRVQSPLGLLASDDAVVERLFGAGEARARIRERRDRVGEPIRVIEVAREFGRRQAQELEQVVRLDVNALCDVRELHAVPGLLTGRLADFAHVRSRYINTILHRLDKLTCTFCGLARKTHETIALRRDVSIKHLPGRSQINWNFLTHIMIQNKLIF